MRTSTTTTKFIAGGLTLAAALSLGQVVDQFRTLTIERDDARERHRKATRHVRDQKLEITDLRERAEHYETVAQRVTNTAETQKTIIRDLQERLDKAQLTISAEAAKRIKAEATAEMLNGQVNQLILNSTVQRQVDANTRINQLQAQVDAMRQDYAKLRNASIEALVASHTQCNNEARVRAILGLRRTLWPVNQ